MYLLYKRLEFGDTPDLFEGWICVWICCKDGRCSSPAIGGRGGQGDSDQESFPFAGHVTTLRIRVREVSRNRMRTGEGQPSSTLRIGLTLGLRSVVLE